MRPVVFIHTNDKQLLGARVGAYLLKARSKAPDAFDVHILRLEDTPHLHRREGHRYLRKGKVAVWKNADLQSFSPLRMMVPQLMGFSGRALLIDPDVFAVGDVYELLTRDMRGKAILAKKVAGGYKGNGNPFYASSVMLLECSRLRHWDWKDQIDAIFEQSLDYGPWIALALEDPTTIGPLEEEWNHFDTLTPRTRLLHNTERSTQPWKTGLPVDYDTTSPRPSGWPRLATRLRRLIGASRPDAIATARYLPHPDPAQERFFFAAVEECLQAGAFDERFVEEEIRKMHVRQDLLERIVELKGHKADAHGR